MPGRPLTLPSPPMGARELLLRVHLYHYKKKSFISDKISGSDVGQLIDIGLSGSQ